MVRSARQFACRPLLGAALLVSASQLHAVILYKANNLNDLTQLDSWYTTEAGITAPVDPIATSTALHFSGSGQGSGAKTLSLGGSLSVGGIRVDNISSILSTNITINGAAGQVLTLNGTATSVEMGGYATAGIVLNSGTGGTLTINADLALGGSQQWVTSRALTATGALNLGASTLSFNTAGSTTTVTLSGLISGSGGLNKTTGAGSLVISNTANTYTGSNTFVGGVAAVSRLGNVGSGDSLGNQASGSRTIALNGSVLRYVGSADSSSDRVIDLRANSIIQNNSATGTLALTSSQFLTGLAASARTLTFSGSNTGANTYAGVIANSGTGANITTLQKSDVGTWVFTGASTATGGVIINQGTLRVTGAGILPGLAAQTDNPGNIWFTSANSGAVLEFESAANLGAASQLRFRNTTGPAPGAGGMLRYIGTTDQTVSKAIQCDTSVGVRLASDSVGGKLVISGSWTNVGTSRPVYFEGSGTGLNEVTSVMNTGAITKRGVGTWLLSGNNTFATAVSVSAGTLMVGHASALGTAALGTTVLAGGVLDLNGFALGAEALSLSGSGISSGGALINSSGNAASLSGAVTLAAAAAIGGTGNLTLSGGISGTGLALTKIGAGTLTLSAANSHGDTTVAAGTLALSGSGTLGTGTTTVTGGTLDLGGLASSVSIVLNGGSLAGAGAYAGSLAVSGNSAISGAIGGTFASGTTGTEVITVSAGTSFTGTLKGVGTLSGDVSLATNSIHAPGNSPGLQTVTGDLTYANQSTVQWELFANSEAGRGTSFDGIDVGGDLTLGTAPNGVSLSLVFNGSVDWADAFWAANRSWLLYDVAGTTTGFSNLQITSSFLDASGDLLSTVRSNASFGLQQVGSDIRITYSAIPEPSTYGLALGALALASVALRRRARRHSGTE